jgi:hypothetical protein
VRKIVQIDFAAAMFRRAVAASTTSAATDKLRKAAPMARLDTQARVLEEWFRLPESRRRHATDAVAFAFRLLREQPDLSRTLTQPGHELILSWLMPHLHKLR